MNKPQGLSIAPPLMVACMTSLELPAPAIENYAMVHQAWHQSRLYFAGYTSQYIFCNKQFLVLVAASSVWWHWLNWISIMMLKFLASWVFVCVFFLIYILCLWIYWLLDVRPTNEKVFKMATYILKKRLVRVNWGLSRSSRKARSFKASNHISMTLKLRM